MPKKMKDKKEKKNKEINKEKVIKPDRKKKKLTKEEKKKIKQEKNKNKFSKKHPIITGIFRFIFVIMIIGLAVGGGIFAGIYFGLFGDEFNIAKEELIIGESNSIVVDQHGTPIANLSGDEKRKTITLDEMSPYLVDAYVSIEDERFYDHDGVDLKRTAGAIINTVFGSSSYGGSTITQQLVKNITGDDEAEGIDGITRKVREWSKAYQVERMLTKDQILELYLNILYVGGEGNLHGVEIGAEYYFNKSAKDLDLAESAFLAGINSSPNLYNPYILHANFDNEEERNETIKNKTLTVLAKMQELGKIDTQEEYDAAVAKVEAGLVFTKGTTSSTSNYSYHTDAAIEQVIQQVMVEKEVTRQVAQNYVYSSGLTIYTTVDLSLQAIIEAEYADPKYVLLGRNTNADGTLINETSESAMVVIDHKTGYVVAVSGGLGTKTVEDFYNRSTQATRQPGSTIKPIANIAPALQEKVITAGTRYYDLPTTFPGNYAPKNDGGVYLSGSSQQAVGIREIVAKSQNVPQVKIMTELTPTKSIEYLRNFGITSLVDAATNPTTNDENPSLALGGITNGISPLEMAAAYAAIANGGEYITPIFYTQVLDGEGNVVMAPTQERRRVISEQNAYITTSILQEPIRSGTGTYAAIPGMTVAGKTGTTDDSYDRWFCGFTPYYTAATWYGYDINEEVRYYAHSNPAGQIWDAVMTKIHAPLANASFVQPGGIITATICRVTGGLAVEGCTDTYSEIFTADNLPEKCTGHGVQNVCNISGKLANEHCLDFAVKTFGGIPAKESTSVWTPNGNTVNSQNQEILDICDICQAAPEPTPEPTPDPETPDPETPDPETPDPETPDPETPDPETPDPETPDPETPDPETPDSETP